MNSKNKFVNWFKKFGAYCILTFTQFGCIIYTSKGENKPPETKHREAVNSLGSSLPEEAETQIPRVRW